MTRHELENRIDMLLERIIEELKDEAIRLATSGDLDIESYENNFEAAKIITTVALKNASSNMALTPSMSKEVRNLSKF